MASSTISRESVLAVMPFQKLDTISGEPSYADMKKIRKQINANLISVTMPDDWGRGKGLLGEIQDAAVFLARNGAAYNPPPAAPPSYPVMVAHATTAQREQARAELAIDTKFWAQAQHAIRIIVNQMQEAFDPFIYAELDDPDEGLTNVDIRAFIAHIIDRFATISQTEIDDNLIKFNTGIDPSCTLAVYTRKQELCQEFAADAEVEIPASTMVSTGTKHAVATGGMDEAWKIWKRVPMAGRTWAAWKVHWTAAFQEKRELIKLTGTAFNGMANQATDQSIDYVGALDNLANAALQKNETVEQLVRTNSILTKTNESMQAEIKKLTAIISTFSTSKQPQQPTAATAAKAVWDKEGYCFWHGFKVKVGHNSLTCDAGKKSADYEQHKHAKRGDEQGGCTWNAHWGH